MLSILFNTYDIFQRLPFSPSSSSDETKADRYRVRGRRYNFSARTSRAMPVIKSVRKTSPGCSFLFFLLFFFTAHKDLR